jgi:hypothetical protein
MRPWGFIPSFYVPDRACLQVPASVDMVDFISLVDCEIILTIRIAYGVLFITEDAVPLPQKR